MFIQVIEGKTKNPEALHERVELWQRELMPGANDHHVRLRLLHDIDHRFPAAQRANRRRAPGSRKGKSMIILCEELRPRQVGQQRL